jgi:hypothetical protein
VAVTDRGVARPSGHDNDRPAAVVMNHPRGTVEALCLIVPAAMPMPAVVPSSARMSEPFVPDQPLGPAVITVVSPFVGMGGRDGEYGKREAENANDRVSSSRGFSEHPHRPISFAVRDDAIRTFRC